MCNLLFPVIIFAFHLKCKSEIIHFICNPFHFCNVTYYFNMFNREKCRMELFWWVAHNKTKPINRVHFDFMYAWNKCASVFVCVFWLVRVIGSECALTSWSCCVLELTHAWTQTAQPAASCSSPQRERKRGSSKLLFDAALFSSSDTQQCLLYCLLKSTKPKETKHFKMHIFPILLI